MEADGICLSYATSGPDGEALANLTNQNNMEPQGFHGPQHRQKATKMNSLELARRHWRFFGPTWFAPVVMMAAVVAEDMDGSEHPVARWLSIIAVVCVPSPRSPQHICSVGSLCHGWNFTPYGSRLRWRSGWLLSLSALSSSMPSGARCDLDWSSKAGEGFAVVPIAGWKLPDLERALPSTRCKLVSSSGKTRWDSIAS